MEGKKLKPIEKIFIIEDNELYAKMLKSYLFSQFPGIKTIENFRIGELCLLELFRKPDIVVLDYMLNSIYEDAKDGMGIIQEIKKELPDTDVILLTSLDASSRYVQSIKKYYSSYICKNEDAFENLKYLIDHINLLRYKSIHPANN